MCTMLEYIMQYKLYYIIYIYMPLVLLKLAEYYSELLGILWIGMATSMLWRVTVTTVQQNWS